MATAAAMGVDSVALAMPVAIVGETVQGVVVAGTAAAAVVAAAMVALVAQACTRRHLLGHDRSKKNVRAACCSPAPAAVPRADKLARVVCLAL